MPSSARLGLRTACGAGRGQLEERTITEASRDQLPSVALLFSVFQLGGLGWAMDALHAGGTTTSPKRGMTGIHRESGTVTQMAQEQTVSVAALP